MLGVESADTGRAVNLVTGEGIEIAIEILHVYRQMHRALRPVDQHGNAALVGEPDDLLDRNEGAERVRHLGDRDELRAVRQQLLELIDQEIAVIVHGRPFDRRAMAFPEEMPGHDVGMVLHDREDDLVALLDVGLAPGRGNEVDRLGDVAGEDDLFVAPRIDELRHLGAGALIGFGGGIGEVMQAAMHVGVFAVVRFRHAVEHGGRLLGGGSIVEIDELLAVDLQRQRRKILAHAGDIIGTVGDRRMQGHDRALNQRSAADIASSRKESLAMDSMASPTKAWISSACASFSGSPRARR